MSTKLHPTEAELDCVGSLRHYTSDQLVSLDQYLHEQVRLGKGGHHYHDGVSFNDMLRIVETEEALRSGT